MVLHTLNLPVASYSCQWVAPDPLSHCGCAATGGFIGLCRGRGLCRGGPQYRCLSHWCWLWAHRVISNVCGRYIVHTPLCHTAGCANGWLCILTDDLCAWHLCQRHVSLAYVCMSQRGLTLSSNDCYGCMSQRGLTLSSNDCYGCMWSF